MLGGHFPALGGHFPCAGDILRARGIFSCSRGHFPGAGGLFPALGGHFPAVEGHFALEERVDSFLRASSLPASATDQDTMQAKMQDTCRTRDPVTDAEGDNKRKPL